VEIEGSPYGGYYNMPIRIPGCLKAIEQREMAEKSFRDKNRHVGLRKYHEFES
jgi:hypothetical protein